MAVIGYEKAKNLMRQQGWTLHVTMKGTALQYAELYSPDQHTYHSVRRDSVKKLIPECVVYGRSTDQTAILCYDKDGCSQI